MSGILLYLNLTLNLTLNSNLSFNATLLLTFIQMQTVSGMSMAFSNPSDESNIERYYERFVVWSGLV